MEIRDFAEQIVFGATLADKLIAVDEFTDMEPGAGIDVPAEPGRPHQLGLAYNANRKKMPFPTMRLLSEGDNAATALHFFANHELLALELMALMLLRFPDAPAAFRRGLVVNAQEEQAHLALYLARLRALGLTFGDLPVSDFFWSAIAPVKSPLQFIAGMSLTFEQANLDYSKHYGAAFENIGDDASAAVLKQIYHDEIGHVRYGSTWLARWRQPDVSDWDAYRAALVPPLTPSRAKGIGFNEAGRLSAGISQAFIDELAVYSHSRGRSPNVFYFNPNCEAYMARNHVAYTPPKGLRAIAADLAPVILYLAVRDDAVILPKRPSSAFLKTLVQAGIQLPEIIEADGAQVQSSELRGRRLLSLQPWAWSPDAIRDLAPLQKQVTGSSKGRECWSERIREFSSKTWSSEQLARWQEGDGRDSTLNTTQADAGVCCRSVADVDSALLHWRQHGYEKQVIKAPFASSGQLQLRVASDLSEQVRERLARMIAEQGSVVVEPQFDVVLDFSVLFDLDVKGDVRLRGITRCLNDRKGRYLGSIVGRLTDGMARSLLRFFFQGGIRQLRREYMAVGRFLGNEMHDGGYAGPFGIDAMVHCDASDSQQPYRFRPIVEVNCRYTMGRVALALQQHLAPGAVGLWMSVRVADVLKHHSSMNDFAARIQGAAPLQFHERKASSIASGILFTTEPSSATTLLTMLSVGPSLMDCLAPILQEAALAQWLAAVQDPNLC